MRVIKTLPALVFLLGVRALAQIPAATSAELQSLAARAQVIFTGQVAAIDRNDAAGFVDIRFRVDQSLRGAPPSGTYVLREWAGLWMAHADRYRVGQRMLMLLPARSTAGFSAPVGDTEGAIPLVPTGSADAATPLAADLRWIEARAQRTAAASSTQPRLVAQPPIGAQAWVGPISPLPSAGKTCAAQPTPLTSVLVLLGGAVPTTVRKGPANAR